MLVIHSQNFTYISKDIPSSVMETRERHTDVSYHFIISVFALADTVPYFLLATRSKITNVFEDFVLETLSLWMKYGCFSAQFNNYYIKL